MALSPAEREYFDDVVEQVLEELPEMARRVFDELPLIIEDYPSKRTLQELGAKRRDEICGLHQGVPLTERTSGSYPDQITIFRLGILKAASDDRGRVDPGELAEQIRITILHEVGHHFGLTEDDLDELGYG